MNNWKVWKEEREYRSLFWAGVINGIGNRFTQVAVLTLLYRLTDSAIAIGFLFVVRMVPFVLSPLAGMITKHISKKKLLVTIDFIRAPLAIMPMFVQSTDYLWVIYVSACCIAIGEAIYAPTRMSSIPLLVKQDRLLYVNAIEQIMVGAVLVFGSSAGGLVSYLFGLSTAFVIDGISFLFSAVLIMQMTYSNNITAKKKPKTLQPNISMYKILFASSVLITLVFIEFTMPLANGIDNVLMSIYALDVFNMGDVGVGLIYACLGLGFMLSSLFSKLLNGKFIGLIIVCIGLEGFGHIMLGGIPTFSAALLVVIWITFVGGISNICLATITMKVIPKSRQPAFFGMLAMIHNLSMAFAMGIGGWLTETFAPRKLSVIVGITYIGFALLYAILLRRLALAREKRYLWRHFG